MSCALYFFADYRTDALPVHYVFPRRRLDAAAAAKALRDATEDLEGKGVVVMWDVAYDWLAGEYEDSYPTNFR